MSLLSVGIREFRTKLAEYLLKNDQPVAVTRHGAIIGYFIPAQATRTELDHAALKQAAVRLTQALQAEGLSELELDKVAQDFRTWRRRSRK